MVLQRHVGCTRTVTVPGREMGRIWNCKYCQKAHKLCAKYLQDLISVTKVMWVNWPHVERPWQVRAAPINQFRAESLLVFTVPPLTRLPTICEVLQTHLPHPGPVMAFLNVHVGLHLSQGEGKGGRYRSVIQRSSTKRATPCTEFG